MEMNDLRIDLLSVVQKAMLQQLTWSDACRRIKVKHFL